MKIEQMDKDNVLKILETSTSMRDFLSKIGMSSGGYANNKVKEYFKANGIKDPWNYQRSIYTNVTRESLQSIIYESNTYKEILIKLGNPNPVGSSYRILKEYIKNWNLDTSSLSHYNKNSSKRKISDFDVYKVNSKISQRQLRKRVLKDKLIPYKCVYCGNTGVWNGKKLTLTLDHKNGIRTDNRLENLQFVCPNCDSQQDTFGAKNSNRYFMAL